MQHIQQLEQQMLTNDISVSSGGLYFGVIVAVIVILVLPVLFALCVIIMDIEKEGQLTR